MKPVGEADGETGDAEQLAIGMVRQVPTKRQWRMDAVVELSQARWWPRRIRWPMPAVPIPVPGAGAGDFEALQPVPERNVAKRCLVARPMPPERPNAGRLGERPAAAGELIIGAPRNGRLRSARPRMKRANGERKIRQCQQTKALLNGKQ